MDESLKRGLDDMAAGRVSIRDDYLDEYLPLDKEGSAYLINALFQIDQLRSLVHDILTGRNDMFAKISLLDSIDFIERSVKAALK